VQLNVKTTEDELKKAFKVFGPVVGCTVMWKTHCAYVDFEEAESATRARRAMNGAFLGGSALRVEFKVSSVLQNWQAHAVPNNKVWLCCCSHHLLHLVCVEHAAAAIDGCRCVPALLCTGKS